MHIIGKFFDGIVLLANLIVLGVFLISAFSDHISPQTIIYASFLGLIFPFLLIVVILFLLYWIFRKRWYAFITLFVLLLCWEPITRYVPYHILGGTKTSADSTQIIKLLTYNTCGLGQNGSKKSGPELLEFIKNQDADIVCLQEYTFHNRPDKLTENKIKETLSAYPYYIYTPASANYNSGVALFSKYPIEQVKAINYESLYNSSCFYKLNINGNHVALINNHLESNQLSREDREFYNQMIQHFDSNKLQEVRTTLIHKLKKAYIVRSVQADTIHNMIEALDMPVIVCGDFNDTPISYCYQRIRGSLSDAFRESGFGPGITYHEQRFLFRIDHIFHSKTMHAFNAKVHHVMYSDHYPVSVSLILPKK